MKLSLFVVLAIVSILGETSGKAQPQYFCGRRLADTLALFCPSTELVKRSSNLHKSHYYPATNGEFPDSEFGEMGLLSSPHFAEDDWMFRGGLKSARGKRGIVSECCDNPCTIEELLTYC
ncbi:unnamed protein product [Chilo suppressalis]|uniref:Insulin-like domain-containing protein n=1 Tax=Chilo suppressalis TaxID=168631 RepID=A0ABN8AQG4_CHISP|nr:unnamed protein product [Chilo suppressalis]